MAAVTDLLRIGVAGLGAVAQAVHLPLLARRYDLFEIGAVCDLSARLRGGLGAQYGIPEDRRFADVSTMIDGADLDAVVLLTTGSHGVPALQLLQRSVPVFCEKPLAYTVAEVDVLHEAERALGTPSLFLAYMKEHDDAVIRLAERLAEVDDVRAVETCVLHPTGESQLAFANLRSAGARSSTGDGAAPAGDVSAEALEEARELDRSLLAVALGPAAPRRLRELYSGVVLGSMVHNTSLLRSLFGGLATIDDVRVWPVGANAPAADDDRPMPGHPPSVEVSGALAGGVRARMSWHYLPDYPAYRETLTVHHARGSFQVSFGTPYIVNSPTELVEVSAGVGGEVRSTYRSTGEAFENELVDFHRMVTEGRPPRAGIAEGRQDIVTSQQIIGRLAGQQGTVLDGEAAHA